MNKKLPQLNGLYLTRKLGSGGFGTVFHGYRSEDMEPVAVKILKQASGLDFELFSREAVSLLKQINNPNIVDLIQSNLDNRPPYIVMEFCDGGSLRSWVGENRSWKQIALALLHVVRGLTAIHKAGGFHRDIKPDNLLLKKTGAKKLQIKLGDLGLARIPSPDSKMTYSVMGTRGYIAPEVIASQRFSQASDIYALGVTGTELLTGSRVYDDLDSAQCPREFKALLKEMMVSSSAARPNVDEIAQKLKNLLTTQRSDRNSPPPRKNIDPLTPWLVGGLVFGGLAWLAKWYDDNDKAK